MIKKSMHLLSPVSKTNGEIMENKKNIIILDSDHDSDAEVISSSLQRHEMNEVVDLTKNSKVSSSVHENKRSRRLRDTDDEVEFIGSTSATQSAAINNTASVPARAPARRSDAQFFVGTKRPSNTNYHHSFPHSRNNGDRHFGQLFGAGRSIFNPEIGTRFDPSANPTGRYGPIPVNDQRSNINWRRNSNKRKNTITSTSQKEEKPLAMMKGKAMQQPQGFDAIDMFYPHLKANDRTNILHNLLSKCTRLEKSKKFVHDFRVQFEKTNKKCTLWSLAKALSDEITRLEGESKLPAKENSKYGNGIQQKENKPNVDYSVTNNDSDSETKPTAPIGSLSGSVLDTLAKYFRAHLAQKDHKAMLDVIEPKESPDSLTCSICAEDFDGGDTVACNGDEIHFFCKPCLSSYCTLTLESGPIQSITCAIPNCKALFATPDIKSVLSEYDVLRIEHREDSRDRRVAMSAKAMLHCECGVVAIVTDEDMGDGRITCPGIGCGRRFCAKCGNEDHGKESCPPPAETVQWLDKNSKQCPNCSNRIEKNGGCDHMTCRPPGGCGYEFWWTCGCRYPGPHKCGR